MPGEPTFFPELQLDSIAFERGRRTSPRAWGLRLREAPRPQACPRRGCCLLVKRTRSAPRNSTRFAAQYPARGHPCERFAAGLATRLAHHSGPRRLARPFLAEDLHLLFFRQLDWRTRIREKMAGKVATGRAVMIKKPCEPNCA